MVVACKMPSFKGALQLRMREVMVELQECLRDLPHICRKITAVLGVRPRSRTNTGLSTPQMGEGRPLQGKTAVPTRKSMAHFNTVDF